MQLSLKNCSSDTGEISSLLTVSHLCFSLYKALIFLSLLNYIFYLVDNVPPTGAPHLASSPIERQTQLSASPILNLREQPLIDLACVQCQTWRRLAGRATLYNSNAEACGMTLPGLGTARVGRQPCSSFLQQTVHAVIHSSHIACPIYILDLLWRCFTSKMIFII